MNLPMPHSKFTFTQHRPTTFGSVIGRKYSESVALNQYQRHGIYKLCSSPAPKNLIETLEEKEDYTTLANLRDLPKIVEENTELYQYQIEYRSPVPPPTETRNPSLQKLGVDLDPSEDNHHKRYQNMKVSIEKEERDLAILVNGVFINDIDERYPDTDPSAGDRSMNEPLPTQPKSPASPSLIIA